MTAECPLSRSGSKHIIDLTSFPAIGLTGWGAASPQGWHGRCTSLHRFPSTSNWKQTVRQSHRRTKWRTSQGKLWFPLSRSRIYRGRPREHSKTLGVIQANRSRWYETWERDPRNDTDAPANLSAENDYRKNCPSPQYAQESPSPSPVAKGVVVDRGKP